MASTNQTRELILRYWKSWQQPSDFEDMRSCLADDVNVDAGVFAFKSADAFMQMVVSTDSPWMDVGLLHSMFDDDHGAIFYEGTEINTGNKFRVAEYAEVSSGKISKLCAVITQMKSC